MQEQWQFDIFLQSHGGQQIEKLKNQAKLMATVLGEHFLIGRVERNPRDLDLSGSGAIQPTEQMQQGALAAAARARDRDKFPGLDLQRKIIQSMDDSLTRGVGTINMAERNHDEGGGADRKVTAQITPEQSPRETPKSNPIDNFTIVAETSDFIAINKPAGLLIHPTKPDGTPTLWEGLKNLLVFEFATGARPGLLHRLDRETSGLVLIAKNSAASGRVGRLFMSHEVQKTYLALCHGWPKEEIFSVEAPIIRLGEVQFSSIWLRRGVHPSGQPAQTDFVVLARRERPDGSRYSLVEARPRTGRTHQIRVHLAHLGHPIIGDKLYTSDGWHYLEFIRCGLTPELTVDLWRPFHALHAAEMTFIDEGVAYRFSAPAPEDFHQIPAMPQR